MHMCAVLLVTQVRWGTCNVPKITLGRQFPGKGPTAIHSYHTSIRGEGGPG